MATPTIFPQFNAMLSGGPGERWDLEHAVVDLPVWKSGSEIASCWQLSAAERLNVLLHGRVWIRVVTRETHPPIGIEATRSIFVPQEGDSPVTNPGDIFHARKAELRKVLDDPTKPAVDKLAECGVEFMKWLLDEDERERARKGGK